MTSPATKLPSITREVFGEFFAEVYDAAPRLCGQSAGQLVGVGGRVLGDTVGFQDLGFSLFGDLVPQAANSFA